ncbi:MAG: MerC domain-containing protein [Verrucomicrobiota bacterium]
MQNASVSTCRTHSWLDHLAIGMATVCAVHCLLTPVLIIALPIIATSLFVHEDFHLWMLLLVLPTTGFAILMGCRKHKDKWVAALSAVGLSVLIIALVQERMLAAAHDINEPVMTHCETCASCSRDLSEEPIPMHAGAWFNTLGGLFLASAHFRNFRLCRRNRCDHEHN